MLVSTRRIELRSRRVQQRFSDSTDNSRASDILHEQTPDRRSPISTRMQFSHVSQCLWNSTSRTSCELLLRFTPNVYHGEKRYLSLVKVSVFVNMCASFSLVSTGPNGFCVIFRKLKFTVVYLKCPSFAQLPRSTASHCEPWSAK